MVPFAHIGLICMHRIIHPLVSFVPIKPICATQFITGAPSSKILWRLPLAAVNLKSKAFCSFALDPSSLARFSCSPHSTPSSSILSLALTLFLHFMIFFLWSTEEAAAVWSVTDTLPSLSLGVYEICIRGYCELVSEFNNRG